MGSTNDFGKNKRFTENRVAWVYTEASKIVVLQGDPQVAESGADLVLYFPRPGKLPDFTVSLTDCTEQELDAIKDLVMFAIDQARPVVQLRDKEAQDAWDNGDDSFTRSYRAVPTVVYRPRAISQHSQGVHERPAGVPEGSQPGRGSDSRGVRGAGDGLAQSDSGTGGSQDTEQKAD